MVVLLGRATVAAPSFTPLQFGLLSAADVVTEGDARWEGGIEFEPDACAEASATTDACPDPYNPRTLEPTSTGLNLRGSEPFTVYSFIDCSTVGMFDEYEQRTDTLLTRGEDRAVERVFWTGDADGFTVNPHLAADAPVVDARGFVLQTPATVVDAALVSVRRGIGLLEGALAECYGGEGVLHVPRSLLPYLHDVGVTRVGALLRTISDNRVAAYSSNNVEGPTGMDAAAGTAWLYATGAVNVRRTGIRHTSSLRQAIDRSNNSMVYIAERTYVIAWDCCHFAVRVALP